MQSQLCLKSASLTQTATFWISILRTSINSWRLSTSALSGARSSSWIAFPTITPKMNVRPRGEGAVLLLVIIFYKLALFFWGEFECLMKQTWEGKFKFIWEWFYYLMLTQTVTNNTSPPLSASFSICERVTPRLSHANSAVVLSAVKVLMKFLELLPKDSDYYNTLLKKLSPPLVTLLSGEPEVQYVALRNINLIVQKRLDLFFFCFVCGKFLRFILV